MPEDSLPLIAPDRATMLAEQLRLLAAAKGRTARTQALDQLAELMRSADATIPFLSRLAGGDRNGHRLALELVNRLPVPLHPAVITLLPALLTDAGLASQIRFQAVAQMLRSLPPNDARARTVVSRMVRRMPPHRALQKLRHLKTLVPNSSPVAELAEQLAEQAAITCPRCKVRLPKPEMMIHLWKEHRLMLEGDDVRDPWELIDQWIADFSHNGQRDLLERACELGRQLDSDAGLERVHRLLLTAGLSDEEAEEHLRSIAVDRRAGLCPNCYALVRQPVVWEPPAINLSRGRMASHGYCVQIADGYLFTQLTAQTPDRVLHHGPEPGRMLTRRGLVLLQVGPCVLIALLLAFLFPAQRIPPLTPVALVLLLGLGLYLRLRLRTVGNDDPTLRALDYAWKVLVPFLHSHDVYSRQDAEFLATLARASLGLGTPAQREQPLQRIAKLTEQAVLEVEEPAELLTPLTILGVDDAIRRNSDPLILLADQLGPCLTGELPLRYAEQIVDAWSPSTENRALHARLRVLTCGRAFAAGLYAEDLRELGHASPKLGQVLASEDFDGLCRLGWLWELRSRRPWKSIGQATTVFDLARYPSLGGQYLEMRPDLFLFQFASDGEKADSIAPILICEYGVVYRGIEIDSLDIPIRTRPTGTLFSGFELKIGEEKLNMRVDPEPIARRLKEWLKFLYGEFLPGAEEMRTKRNPEALNRLLRQKILACSDCGHAFLHLEGEVGLPAEAVDEG